MDSPRDDHYFFAHEFLRDFYFNFYETLNSGSVLKHSMELDSLIKYLWYESNKLMNNTDWESIESVNFTVDVIDFDEEKELWVITMPEPKYKTEAYFTGTLHTKDESRKIQNPIFFTLEYTDEDRSFFCYWDRQESHHNLGLSEPTKEAFIQNIRNFYQKVSMKF